MDLRDYHKFLSPRVTVLMTVKDKHGKVDVAPMSFVMPISFNPPLLAISIGTKKHSYEALMDKKEFVLNIPTEEILEKVWIAGGKHDPEISKIERAGLTIEPSEKVSPPRLKECPIAIECFLKDAKKYGDHVLVIGEVVGMRIRDEILDEEGFPRVDTYRNPLHIAENIFALPYLVKRVE